MTPQTEIADVVQQGRTAGKELAERSWTLQRALSYQEMVAHRTVAINQFTADTATPDETMIKTYSAGFTEGYNGTVEHFEQQKRRPDALREYRKIIFVLNYHFISFVFGGLIFLGSGILFLIMSRVTFVVNTLSTDLVSISSVFMGVALLYTSFCALRHRQVALPILIIASVLIAVPTLLASLSYIGFPAFGVGLLILFHQRINAQVETCQHYEAVFGHMTMREITHAIKQAKENLQQVVPHIAQPVR